MPFCVSCGVANVSGARFCKACGAAVASPSPLPPSLQALAARMEMPMPLTVAWFERLMYTALGLGCFNAILGYPRLSEDPRISALGADFPLILAIVFLLFSLPLAVWWIWLIARRRKNWARWTQLILLIVSLPFVISNAATMLLTTPVVGALSALAGALQPLHLIMVFSGESRDWFKRPAV